MNDDSALSVRVRLLAWASLAAALVVMSAVLATASASAAEPWWHLVPGARPTNMWLGSNEVQRLEIDEPSKSASFYLLVEEEGGPFPLEGKDFALAGVLPYSATGQQVQSALEKAYGTGNVEVKGASGEAPPFTITTVDSLAGRSVGRIEVYAPAKGVSTSVVTEGGSGVIYVRAINLGDAPVEAQHEPVAITDRLPAGVEALSISGHHQITGHAPLSCSLATVSCTLDEKLLPYDYVEVEIHVALTEDPITHRPSTPDEALNMFTVSGGEAPAASAVQKLSVSDAPVPYGLERYEVTPESEGGGIDARAGTHPFQLTTTLSFNETAREPFQPVPPRNIAIELPAGLVGNTTTVPLCPYSQFVHGGIRAGETTCPPNTAIGVAEVTFKTPNSPIQTSAVPVFNLSAGQGEPARFGFEAAEVPITLDTAIRSGQGYGVTVTVHNTTEAVAFYSSTVTLWGTPGSQAHDQSRGNECLYAVVSAGRFPCVSLDDEHPVPFLDLPTTCANPLSAPLLADALVDSWDPTTGPAQSYTANIGGQGEPLAMQGCNQLAFAPGLELSPSSSSADQPIGLTVHLKVPQNAEEAPEAARVSDVESTTVTLPAGLQINPAAAAGLGACAESEIGFEKLEADSEAIFTEETEAERLGEAPHSFACPEASKLGSVTITTPLLSEPLEGSVYQAAQDANPFKSLLALYVVAESKRYGVRVRLAGEVKVASDGQITSTFKRTPQLPFEEFQLKFFEGNQAPLATTGCGVYKTESVIEPWSGNPAATPSSEFDVTSAPNGGACVTSAPFAPAFAAGTTNNSGSSFSPFTTAITRNETEQPLSTVAMTLPLGIAGDISKVTLCQEAEANEGACPASSKIGHVIARSGVGKEPITLPEPGKPQDPVYITGPYKGAPFGLSIVVPAEAGPFNLDEDGRPVVVRGKINVNPYTSQVSVETEPMRTRLQGIPLDVRDVEVAIDKQGFMFNPTNCEEQHVTGTIGSSEGASESVSSRFQAADCASLPFKPHFSATTHSYHSRKGGAYLGVKITSGAGEANLHRVHVTLPGKLPSRLDTLKQACTEEQFAANPAGCPEGAFVGTVVANTPVLPVPLTGPAIFVSHGGRGFPNLDFVLQGDGVTQIQEGETFINKKSVTTSTFPAVPDIPITSIEVKLPEGPHSALAANGNLCRKPLYMPTELAGQNGAVIEKRTRIKVEGCKPAIEVVRSKVKGATAKIVVRVPTAGRLVARGHGITRVVKKLRKAKTATLKVSLTRKDRRLLAKHPKRSQRVKVRLRFTPKKKNAKPISNHVTVLMK